MKCYACGKLVRADLSFLDKQMLIAPRDTFPGTALLLMAAR